MTFDVVLRIPGQGPSLSLPIHLVTVRWDRTVCRLVPAPHAGASDDVVLVEVDARGRVVCCDDNGHYDLMDGGIADQIDPAEMRACLSTRAGARR